MIPDAVLLHHTKPVFWLQEGSDYISCAVRIEVVDIFYFYVAKVVNIIVVVLIYPVLVVLLMNRRLNAVRC